MPIGSRDLYWEGNPEISGSYIGGIESFFGSPLECYEDLCIYGKRRLTIIEDPLFYDIYLKKPGKDELLYRGNAFPRVYLSPDNHIYIVLRKSKEIRLLY